MLCRVCIPKLLVGLQAPICPDVQQLRAPCGQDAADQKTPMAAGRVLLGAHRRDPVLPDSFLQLMAERKIEERISPDLFAVPAVLLCSETTADRCHRRLVCAYLQDAWGDLEAIHL